MEVFELEDGIVYPTKEILLIEPFKTIWEKDTSRQKEESIKIFTYVNFLCNPRRSNPYFDIDEKERSKHIKKEIWGDENYNHPDYLTIIEAVVKYKSLLEIESPSLKLYLSAVQGLNELTNFINTVDLNERTAAGGAVYKPADITRAFKELPDTKKTIETLRASIHNELQEAAKTRGSREIGDFER